MNESKSNYGLKLEAMLPVIEEKLKAGGSVTFGPHGVSMLPLIRQGKDSVTIEALSEEPKVGDVIFYRRPDGQFVLHRIVGKDSRGFVLCGDNQWQKEYGVEEQWVIGKMTSLDRDGEVIRITDTKYLRYVKRLGFRRGYLRIRGIFGKIKRKLLKK